MGSDGQAVAPMEGNATSLRYLRLQNGFRNMMKAGMDRIDQQTFMDHFKGQAEARQLQLMWGLLKKQQESVIDLAMVEMEAACSEVGLQQQLEELEALILQRGLLGKDSTSETTTTLPSAAEAAERMKAKQAEKRQLQETLQQLQQQQQATQAELEQKQKQASDLLREFDESVGDQVDKVYRAAKQWVQPAQDAEPMQQ